MYHICVLTIHNKIGDLLHEPLRICNAVGYVEKRVSKETWLKFLIKYIDESRRVFSEVLSILIQPSISITCLYIKI